MSRATVNPEPPSHAPLSSGIRWLMRLRWIAGAAFLLAAPAALVLDNARPGAVPLAGAGAGVLLLNLLYRLAPPRLPDVRRSPGALRAFAALQIHLDLLCLAALTAFSGGLDSPLVGFFLLHMVFAGLLLPARWAYATACWTVLLLAIAILLAGGGFTDSDTVLRFLGWTSALLMGVYLTESIARALTRRDIARIRKNRRLRQLTSRLRAQQVAMIQHEKMAAMGRLAAGVAHEINNPLSSMDSALQLMERNPEAPRPATVKALRDQVKRIHGTVRDLTAFAHPDRGRAEPYPLNEVVSAALQMLGFDHRLRRGRVDLSLSEQVGAANIAPRSVQQVVMNLVLNALDAMADTPEPTLQVRTRRDGPWCLIEVADNGCGISPERLDRIFEPFYTTKPVGAGTGLGLSISATLVRELGGRIDVSSRPGDGTVFTVRLPAAGEAPERHERARAASMP